MDTKSLITTALNTLLSSLLAIKSWPLAMIAGLENPCILIAALSAATGTLIACKTTSAPRYPLATYGLLGLILVFAIATYLFYFAHTGDSNPILFLLLFLLFAIFLISFYLLTSLEKVLIP